MSPLVQDKSISAGDAAMAERSIGAAGDVQASAALRFGDPSPYWSSATTR